MSPRTSPPRSFMLVASLAALLSVTASGSAQAGEPQLGADLGYTRLMNGTGLNGFGVNVFAGYEVMAGLIPELQLGLHYNAHISGVADTYVNFSQLVIPVMVGARYQIAFGVVRPFIGAHLGLDYLIQRVQFGQKSGLIPVNVQKASNDRARFGFDAGLGVDFLLGKRVALGVDAWYWLILTHSSGAVAGTNESLLNAGIHLHIAL